MADVLVLAVTWYKTYSNIRTAHRNDIELPLATQLLRDGTSLSI